MQDNNCIMSLLKILKSFKIDNQTKGHTNCLLTSFCFISSNFHVRQHFIACAYKWGTCKRHIFNVTFFLKFMQKCLRFPDFYYWLHHQGWISCLTMLFQWCDVIFCSWRNWNTWWNSKLVNHFLGFHTGHKQQSPGWSLGVFDPSQPFQYTDLVALCNMSSDFLQCSCHN